MTSLKLSLILLFLSISAYGQQHLCFEGIPIDGSLAEFTNAMTKLGYTHDGTQDSMVIFTGDFHDFKNCLIGVSTPKDYDEVNLIGVLLPERLTWEMILSDYHTLKNMLIDQYGWPKKIAEYTPQNIADSSSTVILQALHREEVLWQATYTTALGNIILSIVYGSQINTGMVLVQYYDAINSDPGRKEAMDDL